MLMFEDSGQRTNISSEGTVFYMLFYNLPITNLDKKSLKNYKNFLSEFACNGSKSDIKSRTKALKLVLGIAAPILKRL